MDGGCEGVEGSGGILSARPRGRAVGGNVRSPLSTTFLRRLCPPARVYTDPPNVRMNDQERGEQSTANSGINMNGTFAYKVIDQLDFCAAIIRKRLSKKVDRWPVTVRKGLIKEDPEKKKKVGNSGCESRSFFLVLLIGVLYCILNIFDTLGQLSNK